MKKRILSLILAVGMMTALAACGGSTGDSTGDSAGGDTSEAKGIPLKVATYYADTHPDQHRTGRGLQAHGSDEGTEGRYTVELYGNNGLGSETGSTRACPSAPSRCCVTGNLMADRYPALYCGRLPLGLRRAWKQASADLQRSPRSSRSSQDALIQSHYILRGCSINGNRCVSNNVRPINSSGRPEGPQAASCPPFPTM